VVVRQGFDIIGGAQFDINRFTADVVTALIAADEERAAVQIAAEAASAAEQAAQDARSANRRLAGKPPL
ncbi:MAG: hypothetical protein ACO33A_09140, partial [Hyphomonas sp.]